jgi:hypothetical protein
MPAASYDHHVQCLPLLLCAGAVWNDRDTVFSEGEKVFVDVRESTPGRVTTCDMRKSFEE